MVGGIFCTVFQGQFACDLKTCHSLHCSVLCRSSSSRIISGWRSFLVLYPPSIFDSLRQTRGRIICSCRSNVSIAMSAGISTVSIWDDSLSTSLSRTGWVETLESASVLTFSQFRYRYSMAKLYCASRSSNLYRYGELYAMDFFYVCGLMDDDQ